MDRSWAQFEALAERFVLVRQSILLVLHEDLDWVRRLASSLVVLRLHCSYLEIAVEEAVEGTSL